MRVIDAYMLAAETYEKWCKQYSDIILEAPVLIPWLVLEDAKITIARKLKGLGSCPTPEQVNEVIGNGLWTMVPNCFHCGFSKEKVVEFQFTPMIKDEGKTPVASVHLCPECLLQAFILTEES